MAKLSDMQIHRYSLLLWGAPQVGKTVLASQFPNLFYIDLDESLTSIVALRAKYNIDMDFTTVSIDETPTTDPTFTDLCGTRFGSLPAWLKFKKLVEIVCRKMEPDHHLVVDNISRAAEYLIAYIKAGPDGQSPMQIRNWMVFVDELQTLISSMRYSRGNIILIGHEETRVDRLSGEQKVLERLIYMPTKMRQRLPAMVSDSLRLSVRVVGPPKARRVVRFLQSTPDAMSVVGSRTLVPDMESPTYTKMKSYLEKALNRTLPPATWDPPDGMEK